MGPNKRCIGLHRCSWIFGESDRELRLREIPFQLAHSRWVPFFAIFFHSLAKVPDIQDFRSNDSKRSPDAAMNRGGITSSPAIPLRWKTLMPGLISLLLAEAVHIRMFQWLSISSTTSRISPDVIRLRIVVKCSLHLRQSVHRHPRANCSVYLLSDQQGSSHTVERRLERTYICTEGRCRCFRCFRHNMRYFFISSSNNTSPIWSKLPSVDVLIRRRRDAFKFFKSFTF